MHAAAACMRRQQMASVALQARERRRQARQAYGVVSSAARRAARAWAQKRRYRRRGEARYAQYVARGNEQRRRLPVKSAPLSAQEHRHNELPSQTATLRASPLTSLLYALSS